MTTPVQHTVPIDQLKPSKTNPRRTFDEHSMAELTESVAKHGVLQPILVRPVDGHMEIVAGECRYRAAKAAGLEAVPAVVRELEDDEVLELQLIENLHRRDLHPLEEADGYRRLLAAGKRDVTWIAERVGKSASYVYDRMKLTGLIDEVRKLFLEDRITAGHAILLARLKAEDQKRAIDPGYGNCYDARHSGLWQHERQLFRESAENEKPGKEEKYSDLKPVSVRELGIWIDKHVKLEAPEVDQMLLPDTAATLEAAVEEKVRVLRITEDAITPEELRGGPKAILGRSWKRADGKHGSKACELSRLGMIVIGAGRGEAFQVCTNKKVCAVHWKEYAKAAKRRATAVKKAISEGKDPVNAAEASRKQEEASRKAELARIDKAKPAIVAALVAAIKKAPTGASGPLGKIVLEAFEEGMHYGALKSAAKIVPAGKTAEDLVRHLAAADVLSRLEGIYDPEDLVHVAGGLNVDVQKILDEVAPKERACRKCGCTETNACPGGCAWATADLCTSCVSQRGLDRLGARKAKKRVQTSGKKARKAPAKKTSKKRR